MKKLKKAAIIFTLVFVASVALAGKVNASIINTLNISVQNPPTPPAPPKKPEPPLPPNIPTSTPAPTPVATATPNSETPQGGSDNGGSNSGSGTTGTGTGGQVLGTSTMAGTGNFAEDLYLSIMTLGGTLSALGIKNFRKVN